jgi:hypothetical protein
MQEEHKKDDMNYSGREVKTVMYGMIELMTIPIQVSIDILCEHKEK